jgi:membrane-associated phospholipid phosphatase
MSRVNVLWRIGCIVEPYCPAYVPTNIGAILVAIDLFPVWIPLFVLLISLAQSEIVLTLFSLAWFTDDYLNSGLQSLFANPPPTVGCGNTYEMPSFATEHMVMIDVMVFLLVVRWKLYISEWRIFMALAFNAAATYARLYIGYNTPQQLYVGAVVGFGYGILWYAVIEYLARNWLDRFVRWPVVRWFYLRNDICQKRSLAPPILSSAAVYDARQTLVKQVTPVSRYDRTALQRYLATQPQAQP